MEWNQLEMYVVHDNMGSRVSAQFVQINQLRALYSAAAPAGGGSFPSSKVWVWFTSLPSAEES